MDEIRNKIQIIKDRFQKISNQFDGSKLGAEIADLEVKINKADFWSDHQKAKALIRQFSDKQKLLQSLNSLDAKINQAFELANDQTMQTELETEINQIDKILLDLELKVFLSGPYDASEAILSIHAGAGGVEAMDWTAMLARMYQRYFDKQDWEVEITDESFGEEAGYKSITILVHHPYAYGLLKAEAGTHRLVRLSPFNADHLRQTSFAKVEVLPVIESDVVVEIRDEDIKFDAFRSSGRGGQNVNKVSTAVRLKHIPTGVVVTAQTQRSQLQNRENAMKLLKAKLWQLMQEEEKQTIEGLKGNIRQASWGNQVRSYVLHPYHMVKDLRTGVETSDTEAVLDGDLDRFIKEGTTTRQKSM